MSNYLNERSRYVYVTRTNSHSLSSESSPSNHQSYCDNRKQELTNDTTDRWRIGRPQLFEFADGSWLPCKKACYLVNLWLHTDMTYPLHVCNGTKYVVVRTSIWASKRTFHCSDESRFLLRVMDGSCMVGAWRQWNTTYAGGYIVEAATFGGGSVTVR